MRNHKTSITGVVMGSLVFLWCSLSPIRARAQGSNAVYGSGGKVSSLAFVDASQYATGRDICQAMAAILIQYKRGTVTGVVVDARGFPPTNGKYPCSVNPWSSTLSSDPGSNVVLLPSGTITVAAGYKWALPENTRLVGLGPYLTIIQAGSGFSNELIDMGGTSICTGTPSVDCQGIVIEHLALDGGGNTNISGIVNDWSQELSRVNDVALTNMAGVGLSLGVVGSGVDANDSGPYSDIYFSGSGTCAQITATTRGIRGLNCVMTAASPCTSGSSNAAICLDAVNNTLQDVTVAMAGGAPQSFPDGILIGSQGSAQNNTLVNINGIGLGNVIHISNQTNSGQGNCPSFNACDITAMGISNSESSSTIKDDLTGTTLTDANIAMYVLGDQTLANPGFSRFTTSPNAQTWFIGTGTPSGACAAGTLYSCTNSCSNGTIFACTGGTSWVKIK
jgi:hypothetical protein